MIQKGYIYIITLVSMLICACGIQFHPIALEHTYMTSIHPGEEVQGEKIVASGKPVLRHNNGNLLRNLNWWALQGIDMVPVRGGIAFDFDKIGPNYTPFGADLPLLDFAYEPVVIRMRARSESTDGSEPILSLQFDDSEGVQANASRPEAVIKASENFADYYFDCSDMWFQQWPERKEVNATIINKALFFVNPGGVAYTGRIHISEIQALPIDSLLVNLHLIIPPGEPGGLIADFSSNNLGDWWNSNNYVLSWRSDLTLRVQCIQAGPGFGAFGLRLPYKMNVKKAHTIIVRARYEGDTPPDLRLDIVDYKGHLSNGNPQVHTMKVDEEFGFVEYEYVFKDDVYQEHPIRRDVDRERITNLLFFVNPGQDPWSGTIFIDSIECIGAESEIDTIE